MAHYLPPAIMRFFQPRPPTIVKEPIVKRKMPDIHGVAQFIHRFNDDIPISEKQETPQEIKVKRRKVKEANVAKRVQKQNDKWDPSGEDKKKTSDAYKTLFVARLNYEVNDDDLKDEFEYYGSITKVSIVRDRSQKSRGYGFVEFESSRDLKDAYNDADGRKIAGRRILVDVERGRTVTNWKPRRLGGGLGGTRIGSESENQKFSGREPPRSSGSERSSGGDRARRSDRDRGDRGDRGTARSSRRGSSRERGGDRDRDRSRRDRDRGGDKGRDRDRDRKR